MSVPGAIRLLAYGRRMRVANPVTLRDLEDVLPSCWDEHTCDPADEWDPQNPSAGHCGVTAMAILEMLGGELLEAEVWRANGERNGVHHWNRLMSGIGVDLTREHTATAALRASRLPRPQSCRLCTPTTTSC